jgi:hypothetical protein
VRFTGEVRVPEVDHPGVPATFVVEGDQAEVLLDGESLGRWSLFDVQASRLVSSAFSVSLDGDEITFIADEPVDFAYKGVDHMAEAWARYKAMTLPRRMVAVGRSRRGTRPSRVPELRQAMLANLENLGAIDFAPPFDEQEEAVSAAATAPPVAAPPPPPPPPPPPVAAPIAPPVEVAPPPVEPEPPAEVESIPMRPGPGLVARRQVPPAPPAVPEVDPTDIFRPEPVAAEPEPVAVQPEPPVVEPTPPETEPDTSLVPVEMLEPEPVPEVPMVPAALLEPEAAPEVPELVRELLDTSSDDDRDETPKRLVVDLGAFEVPPEPSPQPVPAAPDPREPALAASTPAADKSGIFGAVRAAFVRNKGSHEHVFVEAPGGIGIHRNICSECGYISIGLSETESD